MVVHRRSSLLLLVFVAFVATACPPEPETTTSAEPQSLLPADIDAIKQAVKTGAEHYKKGQHTEFGNTFTPEGKLRAPDISPRVGKNQIERFSTASPRIDSLDVSFDSVTGSGDTAQVIATLTMSGMTNNSDGTLTKPVNSQGKLTIDMEKKGSDWFAKEVTYAP